MTGRFASRWAGDERGAATADLVVLMSGVVLLGIATVWAIMGAGVSQTVDQMTAGVAGVPQPDADGQSDASSKGREAAASAEDAADSAAEAPDAADDAASGKSNNGKSDAAHDNPGKSLAKGAAK